MAFVATDVATETAAVATGGPDTEGDVADELLKAVERGDDAAAWTTAQELARAVLANEVVALARAVLEGGPLAVHRALKLAEVVNASEAKATKPASAHGAIRW